MSTLFTPLTLTPGDDLAAAIAAAPAGAVLVLGPGRHELPSGLGIRRPLVLVGSGDATLVAPLIALEADGAVTLRDLAIEGAVRVAGHTVASLQDCRVALAEAAGLTFADDATGEVRACLIERCTGPGVQVADRAAPLLEGCILLDNGDAGLAWEGEAGGEAHGNLCEGNASGIRVAGRAAPRLVHNTLRGNAGDALVYLEGAGGMATANLCDGNRGRDIVVALGTGAGPLLGQNRAFVTRVPAQRALAIPSIAISRSSATFTPSTLGGSEMP